MHAVLNNSPVGGINVMMAMADGAFGFRSGDIIIDVHCVCYVCCCGNCYSFSALPTDISKWRASVRLLYRRNLAFYPQVPAQNKRGYRVLQFL